MKKEAGQELYFKIFGVGAFFYLFKSEDAEPSQIWLLPKPWIGTDN